MQSAIICFTSLLLAPENISADSLRILVLNFSWPSDEHPTVMLLVTTDGQEQICDETAGISTTGKNVPKQEVKVMESSHAYLYSGNTAMAMQYPDPRLNVRFAVYYGEGLEKAMSDYSVNLSFGGIFIESENVLPADTTLFVEFKLPANNRRIRCKSLVAWTNEPENPKSPALPAGMGLQFTDLSLDDVHVIRKYIDEAGLRPTW